MLTIAWKRFSRHAVAKTRIDRQCSLPCGIAALGLAGLPYCASKYAQSAIGHVANAEVLPEGVSVTNIYPGETETPILEKRPVPPSPEQRARMLQPEDIAAMVVTM